MKYSVIIPVYNSEQSITQVIDKTINFFENENLFYEIILVNDKSTDNSWKIIAEKAKKNSHVIAINLLRNYGQHNAVFCGFKQSCGDYVITMDDDLQNPPEEIKHLIEKAKQGYDLVIGQFRKKKHAWYRRLGSLFIKILNQKIFNSPKNLALTNFRIIRRDVVDRICMYNTNYPYITGLALMFSHFQVNVWVRHEERLFGKSNYNILKILKLVLTILFNYSSFPLRFIAGVGLITSLVSLLLSVYFFTHALINGTFVSGWILVIVLLSFFNGIVILLIGMIGEYVVRLLNQSSNVESYYIIEIVEK
jgi:glycosyltransferase involved in cell wall biosynthesis